MKPGWLLAIVVGGAIVSGCQPTTAQSIASIKADFEVLERLEVTNFMTAEGCDYIAYLRGVFVTDPASDACIVDVDGPHPRLAFDSQARIDLDTVLRETAQHGPRLHHAFVNFRADGTVAGDSSFGFSWNEDFVYDPAVAGTITKACDSECEEPLNAEWYRVWFP